MVKAGATVFLHMYAFFDNYASFDGGAFSVSNGGKVTCDNPSEPSAVLLVKNSADGRGGGIFVDRKGIAALVGITIFENWADSDGGGLWIGVDSHMFGRDQAALALRRLPECGLLDIRLRGRERRSDFIGSCWMEELLTGWLIDAGAGQ